MSVQVAQWLVFSAGLYLQVGAVFAVLFALFLVGRIDPAVQKSSWGFRFVILPGATALWPWLLMRVLRGLPPPEEQSPHRCKARCPRQPIESEEAA